MIDTLKLAEVIKAKSVFKKRQKTGCFLRAAMDGVQRFFKDAFRFDDFYLDYECTADQYINISI
ncbi:MAG: hypothetical protein Q8R79_00845 [Legionellaceae bacterium]|nr:hypothetical protein [Legionellaceae bacterium]